MNKFCHKTASYSLADFIAEFKENAKLDQIPDHYLNKAFRSRIDLETSQHLHTANLHEFFEDYSQRCLEVFPSEASQDLIIAQYLYATIDYSNFASSLRNIYNLSIKAYKELPAFQAQFAFRLRLKEILIKDTDLWSFVREYNKANHTLIEDFILRQSHVESECRRKQEGKPKADYTKKSPSYATQAIKNEEISNTYKHSNYAEKTIRKIASLKVNTSNVNVLFDTGSDVSLIHHNLVKHLQLKTFPIQESIKGIGGTSNQTSAAIVYFTISNIKHQLHVYVTNSSVLYNRILVGNDFLDRFPDFAITSTYVRLAGELFYFHDTKEAQLPETHIALSSKLNDKERHEVFAKHIKEKFPSLHSALPYDIGSCTISIPEKHFLPEKFVPQKRYRMNPVQWESLKNHVSTLVNAKILIKQDTKYVSNYVIVQSQGKNDRFAIDLRSINAATVRDGYPTCTVQEIFQEIKGSHFITTIDATKAFLSLQLSPSDYQYYGVYTLFGMYCYTRMPFGDVNAMAAWQRVYDTIAIKSQSPALSYADDMLILDKQNDIYKHLNDVVNLCTVATQHGLKFNVDKCKFAQQQITVLGWLTDGSFRQPGKKATFAMTNRKLSSTVKELKEFLASADFFRDAVKNFTARATPFLIVLELTRKER